MKKIEFPLFGENEFMYLNIGRLIDIERMAGKSAGEIIRSQNLDLGLLTIILSVALRHHKMRTPQWYADKMQKLIDEGIDESRLYIVENGAKKWPYKDDNKLWVTD